MVPPISRKEWLGRVSYGDLEEAQEEKVTGAEPIFVPLVELGEKLPRDQSRLETMVPRGSTMVPRNWVVDMLY
jgi:hypothetical protein